MFSSSPIQIIILPLLIAASFCQAQIVDKSQAVGPCIGGLCPPKHFCAPDKECYPKGNNRRFFRDTAGVAADATGAISIGSCVNGLCPNGFDCINNICYKSKSSPSNDGGRRLSIGPCVNAKCPDGYTCNQAEYKCYSN